MGLAPAPEADAAERARMAMLADLTGGFAHDFNNLLTVIRGAAELASRDRGGGGEHLGQIIDAADHAAHLTAQLLAFAGRLPLRPEPVALPALLAGLRDRLAREVEPRVRVRTMVPATLPAVSADAAALADAMEALAANALDAMPEGGVLTFAAVPAPGQAIRITVADSGIGMSPEVRARACEPFFTTKTVGAGSGLGLAQAHGFARQSGGSLEIESAPGRGTRLTLTLPVAHGEPVAAPEAAAGPEEGTRVLLVEDSNTVAAFAEALLDGLGCTVTRAACAAEALDRLRERAFDLMFSDIVMPGMSGIDLANAVRRDHPELPILLATGHSEQAAREGSAFPILSKPYRRDTLARMMGQVMTA